MSVLRRREKQRLDRRQSLAGVPVFHTHVRLEECEAGTVTLKAKVRRGPGFFDRFRPPVSERSYELDEFGTFVVRQIDHERSVLAIVNAFERRYGMSHREAELGVVAFMKMLMKRNLLSVAARTERAAMTKHG
ncbi:MAG: PqqD family protein [Kiritimatiellae bacterium]|nr:PqqD family protein [Kiritimatiellia bacterium]